MMPVSGMHFLVTLAYLLIGMAGLKVLATRFPDSAFARGLAFLVF